jgi:hypothetical protein
MWSVLCFGDFGQRAFMPQVITEFSLHLGMQATRLRSSRGVSGGLNYAQHRRAFV